MLHSTLINLTLRDNPNDSTWRLHHALIEAYDDDERSRKFIASFFIDIQRLPVSFLRQFLDGIFMWSKTLFFSFRVGERRKSDRKKSFHDNHERHEYRFFSFEWLFVAFRCWHTFWCQKNFVLVLFVVTSSVIIPVASLNCANRKIWTSAGEEKKKTVRQTFNGPISPELNFQSTHTTDMQYLHVHLDGHVIRMETKVNSTRIVGMQLVA